MFKNNTKLFKTFTSAIAALVVVVVVLFLFSALRAFFSPSDLGGDDLISGEVVNSGEQNPGDTENDSDVSDEPVINPEDTIKKPPVIEIDEPTITVPKGNALLILEGNHPKSTLIPEGTAGVPYTQIRFVAPQNDRVDVEEVVVEHTGLFNDNIFTGIVLLDEQGKRMGTSTPLNDKHQARIKTEFRVPAGGARTITVAGDMANELDEYTKNESFLVVVDVISSHDVDGDFPIVGAKQRINPTLAVGEVMFSTVDIAEEERVVEIKEDTYQTFAMVTATAGAVENVLWKGIRFYQSGSASDGAFKNLILQDNKGNIYSLSREGSSKYYTATFGSPILMERGDAVTMTLRGIVIGESGKEIDFDLQELIDAQFTGASHNYDIRPTAQIVTKKRIADDGTFGLNFPQYDSPGNTIGKGIVAVRSATEAIPTSLFAGAATATPILHVDFEVTGEDIVITDWQIGVQIDPIARQDGVPESLPIKVFLFDGTQQPIGSSSVIQNDFARITATTTIAEGKALRSFGVELNDAWEVGDRITLTFIPERDISGVIGVSTGEEISVNSTSEIVQEILIIDLPEIIEDNTATSTPAIEEE